MNLKQPAPKDPAKSASKADPSMSNSDHCLSILAQGVSRCVPEIDSPLFKAFQTNIDSLAQKFQPGLPNEEKMTLAHSVLDEFESYRKNSEVALREQLACWRSVTAMLLDELLNKHGISPKATAVSLLVERIKLLTTTSEIQEWRRNVNDFFHPVDRINPADEFAAKLHATDNSTTNDNPSGLRGGGAAIEHLRKLMEDKRDGFIALFYLNCLDVIGMRFGLEAVEDCLMTVASSFTARLHSEDSVYHWSDSTMLAIILGRPGEMLLAAELDRIVAQNRESTIKIAGRSVMLRIPITFELVPIHRLHSPEDLYCISDHQTAIL